MENMENMECAYVSDCVATEETSEALRVWEANHGVEIWIPKSEISGESEVKHAGDEGIFVVATRVAATAGMI
jgi:hypothetical protein